MKLIAEFISAWDLVWFCGNCPGTSSPAAGLQPQPLAERKERVRVFAFVTELNTPPLLVRSGLYAVSLEKGSQRFSGAIAPHDPRSQAGLSQPRAAGRVSFRLLELAAIVTHGKLDLLNCYEFLLSFPSEIQFNWKSISESLCMQVIVLLTLVLPRT